MQASHRNAEALRHPKAADGQLRRIYNCAIQKVAYVIKS
jgi:hypothetical protein